jgi:Ca-activated chloride channel family protein
MFLQDQAVAQAPVAGQAGDQRDTIRVDVSLVSVLASILDRSNRPVADLTRENFEILEEGRPQRIEVFETETQQPLDLALMVDSSMSEASKLPFEAEAATRFIQRVVRPGDRVSVFEFADAVVQLAPFSDQVGRLRDAMRRIEPGSGTALYDAVYLGSQALERGAAGRRRVLVLMTDAGETTSRADFETARRAALRAEALLYAIIVRPVASEGGRNTAGEHALVTISETTGGAMYRADEVSQLNGMFDQIDRELRTQYRLGYYPQPRASQGSYRRIEVRVRGDYQVRHRTAYYAGGPAN